MVSPARFVRQAYLIYTASCFVDLFAIARSVNRFETCNKTQQPGRFVKTIPVFNKTGYL